MPIYEGVSLDQHSNIIEFNGIYSRLDAMVDKHLLNKGVCTNHDIRVALALIGNLFEAYLTMPESEKSDFMEGISRLAIQTVFNIKNKYKKGGYNHE